MSRNLQFLACSNLQLRTTSRERESPESRLSQPRVKINVFSRNVQEDRPSIPRGGFRRAAGVTDESGRRSGSEIWFGVSFPFDSRVAVEVKVALTRRNSADAVTMYRSW